MATAVRAKWLDRLCATIQEDDPPYIESPGNQWVELGGSRALASTWVDPVTAHPAQRAARLQRGTHALFSRTTPFFSALLEAGRIREVLDLPATDPHPIWHYTVWGARLLAARSQVDEAIAYLRDRAGSNTTVETIARFAEEELHEAGRRDKDFDQYAWLANQPNSKQSTFRALARKYFERA